MSYKTCPYRAQSLLSTSGYIRVFLLWDLKWLPITFRSRVRSDQSGVCTPASTCGRGRQASNTICSSRNRSLRRTEMCARHNLGSPQCKKECRLWLPRGCGHSSSGITRPARAASESASLTSKVQILSSVAWHGHARVWDSLLPHATQTRQVREDLRTNSGSSLLTRPTLPLIIIEDIINCYIERNNRKTAKMVPTSFFGRPAIT